jgi:undecaprenyl pyrophosphate synthase
VGDIGFGGLPDPNLMLKFDGTSVMPVFPPWQMSLTEILYVCSVHVHVPFTSLLCPLPARR